MKMRRLLIGVLAIASLAAPVFFVQAEEAKPVSLDLAATAVSAGNFKTLSGALEKAGLTETLKGEGPFTVFAPTDDAFAALPEGELQKLLADPARLKQLLLYHVVSGKISASDLAALTSIKTMQGQELEVTVDGSDILVDDALVIGTDLQASNGVIHSIDTVLLPLEEEPEPAVS